MVDDGTWVPHTKYKSTELKDSSDYDKLWKVLVYGDLKMIGDHSTKGGEYKLYDGAGTLVGIVNFDAKDNFLGGKFYDFTVTKGRILNSRQAFAKYMAEVEETHGKR